MSTIERNKYADISVKETREILKNSRYRLSKIEQYSSFGLLGYKNRLQILYKRKWRNMAVTDKLDNVCRDVCYVWPIEVWIKYYKNRNRFGARIQKDGTFSVIGWMTNGWNQIAELVADTEG